MTQDRAAELIILTCGSMDAAAVIRDALTAAREEGVRKGREAVASWMRINGFATGHGDTVEDLLGELVWQINDRISEGRLAGLKEAGHKARRYAAYYPSGTDGRNSFIILAEWCEDRKRR